MHAYPKVCHVWQAVGLDGVLADAQSVIYKIRKIRRCNRAGNLSVLEILLQTVDGAAAAATILSRDDGGYGNIVIPKVRSRSRGASLNRPYIEHV